jgi:putative heme transporter
MSGAPVDELNPNPAADDDGDDEEMPRVQMTRRRFVLGSLLILGVVALLYYGLPRLAGIDETWHRIERGDPWWLALALLFSVLSFGGYVVLFRYVFVEGGAGIGLRESYEITMASLAATRVFAAGGAGGIALTAWAMRRAGMARRTVAERTMVFLVLTYVVYMTAMLLVGVGLRVGLLPGAAPIGLTVVPAAFAGISILVTLLLALTPTDLQRRVARAAGREGRLARFAARAATLPASMSAAVRDSIEHVRRRDPAILGSIAYWGFNIGVLWASFKAFGEAPPWSVVVMGYFVGMLGNLLPLPGGVGGVDGGMIGAFIGFGVDDGLAVVAVLTYRAFAFWLPTIPGAIAFFQLRRTVARWREQRERERGRRAAAVARA